MKDFPVFPCAHGMAGLILAEIPYRKEAYILIRSVYGSLQGLISHCVGFCRSAGAEKIYIGGDADLSAYPVYARLQRRSLPKARLPVSEARAELTRLPLWTELYNRAFASVPCAKTYTATPENAYFVYLGEQRIGLGQIIDDAPAALAALEKGRGQDCLCALAKQIRQDELQLLCAEENLPATRLYDRLGFSRDGVQRVWYLWTEG